MSQEVAPPTADTIVALEDVRKIYQIGPIEVQALRGIDLRISKGEYVAIMGPSGSGKSTMLNLLGCLDRPSTGRYLLGQDDVSTLNDDRLSEIRNRRIGFVFQAYNLLQQLTVLENIEVPLVYQGCAPDEGRQRSLAMADRVGLADRVHHRPRELSGGQQQRVAMARALVTDPLIILADEPTGNLDSKTEAEILDLIDELNTGEGKTIIMVTHDDHVAERAHRIIRLKDGLIDSIRSTSVSAPSS